MGVFNLFPFTNFQEKNLDWLLRKTKDIEEVNTEQEALLSDHTEQISENTADIEEIRELLPTSGFTPANRRFIMIGDSISMGYNPDGNVTGWPEILRQEWSLISGTNYYYAGRGGAGFVANAQGATFLQLLQSLADTVTNKETITDIIVAGGVNDVVTVSPTGPVLKEAVNSFCDYVTANYPNASIKYYWLCRTVLNQFTTKENPQAYILAMIRKKNFKFFTHTIDAISRIANFSSDGIHVNQNAENNIAGAISSGSFYSNYQTKPVGNGDVVLSGLPNMNTIIHNNILTLFMPVSYMNINTTGTPSMSCNATTSYLLGDITDGFWIGNNWGQNGQASTQAARFTCWFNAEVDGSMKWYEGSVTLYVYKKHLYMVPCLIVPGGAGFYSGKIAMVTFPLQVLTLSTLT